MGALLTTCLTAILTLISRKPSNLIFWWKWIISYIYIELYSHLTKGRFHLYDMDVEHNPYKVGFLPPPEEVALESPLSETELFSSNDEVFFYGVNSKSEYFITRIARRGNRETEASVYLQLSNGKSYQLQETSSFHQVCSDKRTFICGGLQIHYLSPMRRWRLFFNGLLRETTENETTSNKMVYVKFAMIWRASTDVFDFTSDVNSRVLATSLANVEWHQYFPPLEKLYNTLNFYAQGGNIMGTVNIEGNEDEMELYLFGEKIRFLGDYSAEETKFSHVLGHVFKNGRFVHLVKTSIPNIAENFTFGFASSLRGHTESIIDTENVSEILSVKEKGESSFETKFLVDDQLFAIKGDSADLQRIFPFNKYIHGCITIDCFSFELNSQIGKGIIINGKTTKSPGIIISGNPAYSAPSGIPLVVDFTEKICQNPDITGGKGSSLGKLTELSKELQTFIVPNGIVVTTLSYELFITSEILRKIKKLENVLYNDKVEDTKAACQELKEEITKSSMPSHVLQTVITYLKKLFPYKMHDCMFAVRSSATGEDLEQMSAAGQMETFLGVIGTEEIITAIKKCWASQFSYIAVNYKRQNGQYINSPMAVVIQQMIPCDVAGVLFTCDPLTGNPSILSITANYGLGESVVSGSEEPDTIEIDRRNERELVIKNKVVGTKARRITLKDTGGITAEEIPDSTKQTCCLSNIMIHRLAHLAINIEKSYGSHRDIEWGFWNNNLYIFQSRPVTSGNGETDFEIEHEFDGPLRCESEFFSMCNVGEVMPGATSPLGLEIIMKFFSIALQSKHVINYDKKEVFKYFPRAMVSFYNHVMIPVVDFFQYITENNESAQASAVGFFGRTIDDDELFDMAIERYKNKKHKKRIDFRENIKRFIRTLMGHQKELKRTYQAYSKYHIPIDKCNNSQEMFAQLLYACSDLSRVMSCHMVCTESSTILHMIVFLILSNAMGEVNADVYTDLAQLLTLSSKVECADVPASIESLASHISEDVNSEDFKNMTVDEALQWLETSSTNSGKKYQEFLEKHGHRCLREFDIRSSSWEKDPKSLIQLLQNLIGTTKWENTGVKQDNFQKVISGLKSPLNYKHKLLLRSIFSRSRRAVQDRESAKSLLIRALNEWRKGYRKLAKLMVSEGRIPNEDILYFITLEEINDLLSTRSTKILAKANHRRRRHFIIDKYIFPEITKGFPKPINTDRKIAAINDDNFSMKGIPVSKGVAKGIVRVALDLEEASLLQPGEILVTYSTDIGWSPYFPILAGVVTELGGLISHGAVVSREYGLPCIAGLHGATQQFKTGDYVLLDGNKGILQRLSKTEDL